MPTPIDVFLYSFFCVLGLVVNIGIVALFVLVIAAVVDRRLIAPEFERRKRNNEL